MQNPEIQNEELLEQHDQQPSSWQKFAQYALPMGVILGTGLIALLFWFVILPLSNTTKESGAGFVIPGVPAPSIYDNEMFGWTIFDERKAFALAILRYWEGRVPLDEAMYETLRSLFPAEIESPYISSFFESRGYTFEIENLDSPEAIAQFLKKKPHTPLLFNQLADPEIETSGMLKLLIGITDNGETVVFHDYLLGPAYEMPWEEFEQLWQAHSEVFGGYHRYIAIYPRDGSDPAELTGSDYVQTPNSLRVFHPLLVRIFSLYDLQDEEEFKLMSREVQDSPLFEELHPVLRIIAHGTIGLLHIRFNEESEGLSHLEKANSQNENLNEQYGEWPTFPTEKYFFPPLRLARYYENQGEAEKSAPLYEEAESIYQEWLSTLSSQEALRE